MPPTATLSRPPGRVTQRRARPGLVLGIILAVQLMVVLDATIVNIALPDIASALNFSPANLSLLMGLPEPGDLAQPRSAAPNPDDHELAMAS